MLHECVDTLALKRLHEQVAAGLQNLLGEQQRFFYQCHAAGLIHRTSARNVGRHVGHYKVDLRCADELEQGGERLGRREVAEQELDARNADL